ncbi:MAG: hypothetical protein IT286_05245 [Proteobacteria bacterium]|jgi:hypothetical protein|nr:hypothetical protein [Pseudomonadota bacterium]
MIKKVSVIVLFSLSVANAQDTVRLPEPIVTNPKVVTAPKKPVSIPVESKTSKPNLPPSTTKKLLPPTKNEKLGTKLDQCLQNQKELVFRSAENRIQNLTKKNRGGYATCLDTVNLANQINLEIYESFIEHCIGESEAISQYQGISKPKAFFLDQQTIKKFEIHRPREKLKRYDWFKYSRDFSHNISGFLAGTSISVLYEDGKVVESKIEDLFRKYNLEKDNSTPAPMFVLSPPIEFPQLDIDAFRKPCWSYIQGIVSVELSSREDHYATIDFTNGTHSQQLKVVNAQRLATLGCMSNAIEKKNYLSVESMQAQKTYLATDGFPALVTKVKKLQDIPKADTDKIGWRDEYKNIDARGYSLITNTRRFYVGTPGQRVIADGFIGLQMNYKWADTGVEFYPDGTRINEF